jgi:hypothetical protein
LIVDGGRLRSQARHSIVSENFRPALWGVIDAQDFERLPVPPIRHDERLVRRQSFWDRERQLAHQFERRPLVSPGLGLTDARRVGFVFRSAERRALDLIDP